jgi:hypothetical protein
MSDKPRKKEEGAGRVGRSSGENRDLVKNPAYGPFSELDGIIRTGGDCHAVVV